MREQTDRTATVKDLIEENCHELGQLVQLLQSLTPAQYQQRSGVHGQHTIGKHVRHIIDHYDSFLQSLSSRSDNRLDYEHRERDPALESDPLTAAMRLRKLSTELGAHSELSHTVALGMVHQEGDAHLTTPTSVGRELAFLSSHTIHHMAILGLLVEAAGMTLPEEFGVHPSTLRHWRRQREQIGEAS